VAVLSARLLRLGRARLDAELWGLRLVVLQAQQAVLLQVGQSGVGLVARSAARTTTHAGARRLRHGS
jgi:hypothetical protein